MRADVTKEHVTEQLNGQADLHPKLHLQGHQRLPAQDPRSAACLFHIREEIRKEKRREAGGEGGGGGGTCGGRDG